MFGPTRPPVEPVPQSNPHSETPLSNHDKLRELIIDVFLLEPDEYHLDLAREDVDTWDSLGIVSMAVGVHETFDYHFTPEEATSILTVRDIVRILGEKGISFDA